MPTIIPPAAADLDEWFKLWDRRLERGLVTPEDVSLLFYSDNPPDPTNAGADVWPGFELDLLRWVREQQEIDGTVALDTSSLPTLLRKSLSNLPEATYTALRYAVRKKALGRAWIGLDPAVSSRNSIGC